MEEEIFFYGHPNIRAMHERTIELTKAKEITVRGDCVVGVNASRACADLRESFKRKLCQENAFVRLSLIVGTYTYDFVGYGSPSLTLSNKHDIVIRKSEFVCPRTIAIRCNRASSDIPKGMVRLLKDPSTKGILRLGIE